MRRRFGKIAIYDILVYSNGPEKQFGTSKTLFFEGYELRDYAQTTSREMSYLTHYSKCQMDFWSSRCDEFLILKQLFVHYSFIVCSLFVHYLFMICSLLFISCSLGVH